MGARHCSNAGVEVYESSFDSTLAEGLREMADLVEANETSYVDITTSLDPEGSGHYIVTAYLHA